MLATQGARRHSPGQEIDEDHDRHDDKHLLPEQIEMTEDEESDEGRRRHLGNDSHQHRGVDEGGGIGHHVLHSQVRLPPIGGQLLGLGVGHMLKGRLHGHVEACQHREDEGDRKNDPFLLRHRWPACSR